MNHFKDYLNEKETVYGIFAKTNDPFFIRIIGRSGFDFVILDNEHGPNSVRETYPLIMTALATGIYPVVRVGKLDDITIQRILDLGVSGIQIPQIQSRDDAEKVRKYTKFFPKGKRGVCKYVMAADGSIMDKDEYFRSQNDNVVVIIHIEGIEGIHHFDSIIEVEDIDIIFIGPYDLSQSLGIPGQVNHPKLIDEIRALVEKCKKQKKHVGIYVDDVEAAKRYKDLGVKYIAVSVDVGIFARACLNLSEQLKNL